jgi:phage shock protein A
MSLEDLIPEQSIQKMKHLGSNFDMFSQSIKQITSFQIQLYDSIQALAEAMVSVKADVTTLNGQIGNIEGTVQSYLQTTQPEKVTRDGVPFDDALSEQAERTSYLSRRSDAMEDRLDRLEARADVLVNQDEFQPVSKAASLNSVSITENSAGLKKLRNDLTDQCDDLEKKCQALKSLFHESSDDLVLKLDEKVTKKDLKAYCQHRDLAELCTLFSSLPPTKRVQIGELIPQIFMDTSLSMDEKLALAFDKLHVERERVDLENAELVREFDALKRLAFQQNTDAPIGVICVEAEVCDMATDSGYSERFETRHAVFDRGVTRMNIGTQFGGESACEATREVDFQQLIDHSISRAHTGSIAEQPQMDVSEITSRVIQTCQPFIEKQIASLAGMLGFKVDETDLHNLVGQSRVLEEIKADVSALKSRSTVRSDSSFMPLELDQYVRRDEFFDMVESHVSAQQSKRLMTAVPKMRPVKPEKTTPKTTRPKRPEHRAATGLVLGRNSRLMGVNERYLTGDDGKMYIKEGPTSVEAGFVEPSITGAGRPSYFDRSTTAMDIDGVDAVIDFQPFVPALRLARDDFGGTS